jgi:hypothetical protein
MSALVQWRTIGTVMLSSGLLFCGVWACASLGGPRSDEYNTAALSDELRADYELFSDRCSKCHALSRTFNAGAQTDVFWRNYVGRMRRMPGSGINVEDETGLLRFLHYHSAQLIAKAEAERGPAPGASAPSLAAPPSSASASAAPASNLPSVDRGAASDAGAIEAVRP